MLIWCGFNPSRLYDKCHAHVCAAPPRPRVQVVLNHQHPHDETEFDRAAAAGQPDPVTGAPRPDEEPLRRDQRFVGRWLDCDTDAEDGAGGSVAGPAPAEAEDELVDEVALHVLASEAEVDAQRPGLEVGEDAMNPGQDDMCGHVSGDVRIVCDVGRAGISGPAVGPGCGAGGEVGTQEGVQAMVSQSLRNSSDTSRITE